MAIVPEFLKELLSRYRREAEDWLLEQWHQQLVQQNPSDLLTRMQEKLELGPIEQACGEYRHAAGRGCPATYSLGVLVRALLVKWVYNWSLRQTEAGLRQDLRVQWYVGLRPLEPVPDHTTLFRFESWVQAHQPRAYFAQVLEQIDQDFPAEAQQVQIGDTFAMHARAAQEGRVELLRHTSRCLLRCLGQETGLTAPERERLFGPADEASPFYLSASQRQTRWETTVRGVVQLQQRVRPLLPRLGEPQRAAVQQRLAELEKILRDTCQLLWDEQGQVQQVQALAPEQQGHYQIGGANDPQATLRNHGGKQVLGYNIALAITPRGTIREIQAATGAEPDQAAVPRLIAQQSQQGLSCPPKLLFDQAASAGRTRAQVRLVSAGQTQLVARIAPPTTGARFGPEAFLLDPSGLQLTCPHQRTTTSSYSANNRDGRIFEFRASLCQDCPLWTACRAPDARPDGPRRVFISDYQDEIRQAQTYNLSASFSADIQVRPRVERTIAMLTRYDGLRQARTIGMAHADFQAKMAATARNLRTWLLARPAPSVP